MATTTTTSSTKTTSPTKLTTGGTYTQGQSVTDSSGNTGTVKYDSATGKALSSGQSTTIVSGGTPNNDNTNRFDPNTGRALTPGESVINQTNGQKVTEGTKFVAASDLGNNVKTIPVAPVDGTDYMSILNGITTTDTTGSQGLDTALANQKSSFTNMMDLMQAPPSMEQAYIDAKKQSGVEEKQKIVSDLNAQLNGIQAQAQASQLSVVGQGRGIPEAIIGGQQFQIAKEAAIAALPVSAQLQAAQGNLEMAQQNLDTLFKIKSADMTAQYEYKNKLIQSVYDFASSQEKTKLDYALKKEDRAYTEKISAQEDIKSIASMAMKNGAPASVLTKITNSTDYKSALVAASRYGTDPLDRAIKNLTLQKMRKEAGTLDNGLVDEKILSTTQFKSAQAAVNLKNTLNKAIDAVSKYGNRENLSAKGRGILDTLKVQLRSEISTALEQGVVVPGEAASFDAIAGQLNKSFFIRNKKTLASLNSLASSMDSRVSTQKSALKNTYGVTDSQFNSLLGINDTSMDESSYLDLIDSSLFNKNSPYSSYFQ